MQPNIQEIMEVSFLPDNWNEDAQSMSASGNGMALGPFGIFEFFGLTVQNLEASAHLHTYSPEEEFPIIETDIQAVTTREYHFVVDLVLALRENYQNKTQS